MKTNEKRNLNNLSNSGTIEEIHYNPISTNTSKEEAKRVQMMASIVNIDHDRMTQCFDTEVSNPNS